jgi:hypothetical protein
MARHRPIRAVAATKAAAARTALTSRSASKVSALRWLAKMWPCTSMRRSVGNAAGTSAATYTPR